MLGKLHCESISHQSKRYIMDFLSDYLSLNHVNTQTLSAADVHANEEMGLPHTRRFQWC